MTIIQAALVACALGAPASQGETVLLDFTASWCAPCKQMQPVVDRLSAQGYPVRKVDIDQDQATAQRYRVSGVPCFVMVVGGQETGRIVGATSYEQLAGLFAASGGRGTDGPTHWPAVAASALGAKPQQAPNSVAAKTTVAPDVVQYLLAATVRIQIDDGDGNSVGTGTIVDSREGEALVLTCGHIFRDSKGQGRVTIDLYGDGAPQDVPARVIAYDLESDIGFLSFRPGVNVAAAKIAPPGSTVRSGDPVVNIGCSHGETATARISRVTTIDKFIGPPNLQVAGQPVQGRSGGGLFSAEGYVIGVCNAADPEDDEGLYAALTAIHAELNQAGLAKFCLPTGAVAVAPPPTFPSRMPALGSADAHAATVPTSSTSPVAAAPSDAIDPASEVVCIIRSKSDPQGKSRIVVLDQATPELLRQLHDAQRRQSEGVDPR
jgi:thiol-disulfide isomerase/thioredoxin